MDLKEIISNIVLFIFMIMLIIGITIVVLNQFSPFKKCETKDDNYIIQFGKDYFTCGELKAINTSISLT